MQFAPCHITMCHGFTNMYPNHFCRCEEPKTAICHHRQLQKHWMRNIVAALDSEPLGSIIYGRRKLKITEPFQVFSSQMIDSSASILSAATVHKLYALGWASPFWNGSTHTMISVKAFEATC
jgi:hypothetical protein